MILALACSLLLCAVETTVYIMVVLLLVIIFIRMIQIAYFVPLFPPEVTPQKPVIRLLLRLLRKRNYLSIEKQLRQRSLHQHSNGQPVQEVREGWRAYADEIIGEDHCSQVVNNTSESRENCPVSVDRPQRKRVHWWDGYPTARDSKVAGNIRADDLRRVGIDASILGPPGSIGIGSIKGVHLKRPSRQQKLSRPFYVLLLLLFISNLSLPSFFLRFFLSVFIFKMRPNNQKTDHNPSYIMILALTCSLLLCAVETTVYIMVILLLLVIIFFRMIQIVYVVALFPPEVTPQKPVIRLLLRLLRKRNYLSIEKLRQRSLHQHSNGQLVQEVREGWRAYADEIIGEDHCLQVVNNTSESRENRPISVDRLQRKRVHWRDRYPTARDSKVASDIRADDLRRVGIDASILGPPGSIGIGSIKGIHLKRPIRLQKRSRLSDLKSGVSRTP